MQRSTLFTTASLILLVAGFSLNVSAQAAGRGGSFGGGAGFGGGGRAAFGGGGPALGGGGIPGGGTAFGNGTFAGALTPITTGGAFGNTINPAGLSGINANRFNNGFPFFGFGGGGFVGGPVFNQAFIMPQPQPAPSAQAFGPMQLDTSAPFASTQVAATRQVFVNGTAHTVSSPLVVTYRWPSSSKLALRRAHKEYARKFHCLKGPKGAACRSRYS